MLQFTKILRMVVIVPTVALLFAACTNSGSEGVGDSRPTEETTAASSSTHVASPQIHIQRATVTNSSQATVAALYFYDARGLGGDMAILRGTLGVAGECQVVTDSSSHQEYVPIFPVGAAKLESDATGLRLTYANRLYRPNDEIELVGGAGTLVLDGSCSLPGWTVSR